MNVINRMCTTHSINCIPSQMLLTRSGTKILSISQYIWLLVRCQNRFKDVIYIFYFFYLYTVKKISIYLLNVRYNVT